MDWTPRVFLDTSALIAGLASATGASHSILTLAEAGLIRLVVSDEVFTEAERNLQAKLPQALPAYRRFLTACPYERVPSPSREQVLEALQIINLKDAPLLAAAMAEAVDYLATLNTCHFLADPQVARRAGLRIGTPGDFLAWFRRRLEDQPG